MVMSFAQFTDRSGLRDIETTPNLCSPDLYRSSIRVMPKSTLAEANEKKDMLVVSGFTQVLIRQAKEAYKGQKLRLDLDEMVYAFDSSTIELYLKLSPQTETYSAAIKGIDRIVNIKPEWIFCIQRTDFLDKSLSKVTVDTPIPLFICFGKSVSWNSIIDSVMKQCATAMKPASMSRRLCFEAYYARHITRN